MKNFKYSLLIAMMFSCFMGCGHDDPKENSEVSWWVNIDLFPSTPGTTLNTSGHEFLVKYAVDDLNKDVGEIASPPILMSDVKIPRHAVNPLIAGVYGTDRPDENTFGQMLRQIYNSPKEWHEAPEIQSVHFLRDYIGSSNLVSAIDSCRAGQARILGSTNRAVAAFKTKNEIEAASFLGHSLHIIQDSFSPEHTKRVSGNVAEICSYKRKVTGVCMHSGDTLGDNIWANEGEQCRKDIASERFPRSCMNPLAVKAVDASKEYLNIIWSTKKQGELSKVANKLLQTFESKGSALSLGCGSLVDKNPTQPITASGDSERCILSQEIPSITNESSCPSLNGSQENSLSISRVFKCGTIIKSDSEILQSGKDLNTNDFSCLYSSKSSWFKNERKIVRAFSDGSSYDGFTVNALNHGQGTMKYADGRVYTGDWANGVREGKGFQTWPKTSANTLSYLGQWARGLPNGEGTFVFKNGEVYKGFVLDNKAEGQGTTTYPDGSISVGTHHLGQKNGQFILTMTDGTKWREVWENNVRISVEKV